MIPTFVIFLREGIEASMIVAILLAYLDKIGQRRHFRDVFYGVALAMLLVIGGGLAAYLVIKQYEGSTVQTIFETATFLVAASVLTYMTFWMQIHSRTMSADLQRRSQEALDGKARFGLGVLAFQAVGREGLETMVFTLAIVFASSKQAATPVHGKLLLLGAVLGLAVALIIAYAIFKLGRRINLGLFFRTIGVVLMVFAAGLLADAVENMQQLGWLPFLDHVLWNTSGFLSEGSSLGDVFHSLLGYADQPTVLQVIVWVTFVSVSATLFIRMGRRAKRPPSAPPSAASVNGTIPETAEGLVDVVAVAVAGAATGPDSGPSAPPAARPEVGTRPAAQVSKAPAPVRQ
jgi:high-affinity iron transporter